MSVATSPKLEIARREEVTASESAPQILRDAGKALRQKIPRDVHAAWKPAPSRVDPLSILQGADAERLSELVPIRYGRMMQSPFAFFRGSAAVMAADLAATPTLGVKVQACGDCHLKNFGGFATPERQIVFDINDFDETLPAPWEWDVKRLAASFVLAARSNGLASDAAQGFAMECARSYRKAIREYSDMNCLDRWYARIDRDTFLAEIPDAKMRTRAERRIEKAVAKRGSAADYPKLAQTTHGQIHIRDAPPLIFHPDVTRDADFRRVVDEVFARYRESLPDDRRMLMDLYRFVDAAIKVVGIGSVGTRCWIVLFMSASNDPLFLQLKQAGPSVLEPYAGKSVYPNNGQRVVMGQRLMQAASDIFLGWTASPAGDFYVRQLRDAKVSPLVETFDATMFETFAKMCGRNLARAHAKSGDDARIVAGYLGKSSQFDEAIGAFAVAYADQAERDHAALVAAVKRGAIEAYHEEADE